MNNAVDKKYYQYSGSVKNGSSKEWWYVMIGTIQYWVLQIARGLIEDPNPNLFNAGRENKPAAVAVPALNLR